MSKKIIIVTDTRIYAWLEEASMVRKDDSTVNLESPYRQQHEDDEIASEYGIRPSFKLCVSKLGNGRHRVKVNNTTHPYQFIDNIAISKYKVKFNSKTDIQITSSRKDFTLENNKVVQNNLTYWRRSKVDDEVMVLSNMTTYEHGYSQSVAKHVSPVQAIKRLMHKCIYESINAKDNARVSRINDQELIHEFFYDSEGDLIVRNYNLGSTIDNYQVYINNQKEEEHV